METIAHYEGQLYQPHQSQRVHDALTVEAALQIIVNQVPFTVTMRTPGADDALIRGLLYAEDVYRQTAPLSIQYQTKNAITTIARLQLPASALGAGLNNSRRLLSVSSCGICGKTELDEASTFQHELKTEVYLSMTELVGAFAKMKTQQPTFLQSGGSHAVAALDAQGRLLTVQEDVGRHNAVDKVVGALLQADGLQQAAALLVSGRLSYEIVAKTYSARIPILAAVSAPSSLAVEYAKQFGLTLLGFCRGNKLTCYAHPWRLKAFSESTPPQI